MAGNRVRMTGAWTGRRDGQLGEPGAAGGDQAQGRGGDREVGQCQLGLLLHRSFSGSGSHRTGPVDGPVSDKHADQR